MEKTFVMVKPDGVQRGIVGEIIKRIEQKGFKLVGLKLLQMNEELAHQHYLEHEGKPFFKDLVTFITSGPVVAMLWQGDNAVSAIRTLMGATNPIESLPGTIRGDMAISTSHNVIHGSDSPAAAARERDLFFRETEVLDYQREIEKWIF